MEQEGAVGAVPADEAVALARRWSAVIPDAVTAEVARCAGIAQKAAFAVVAVELAVFGIAAIAAPGVLADTGPLLLAAGTALLTVLPVRFALAFRLSRARVQPAVDMSAWSSDLARQAWRALDGRAETPPSPQAALERLGERSGSLPERLRVLHLPAAGDVAGARAALGRWVPQDAADRVRRARLGAWLDRLETGTADLDGVRDQAAALPGDAERTAQLASIDLDEAIGRGLDGEPPLDLVARARSRLGPLTFETLSPSEQPAAVRHRYRRVVASTSVPGLGCLAFAALVGVGAGSPAIVAAAVLIVLVAVLAVRASGVLALA